ncbi:MAG TPA: type I DNA topoisomerase, partial [Hyphomonas sp.]|nr:type I DNA topoisomerase [Hyphomonas sp.]
MKLVVVESPAKAKTINKYLGKDYKVLASYGHIRDLPSKNGSVDPDNDFEMVWEADSKSAKRISDIASALKDADTLILATDPDREGEAISWHLVEALKKRRALKKETLVERVVFNAITKNAVTQAMEHPRAIDAELVDAYLARRALDYLVGFNLSPVLWRKLPGSRSAGRVQSVALRIVCDRENEIEMFRPQEYWNVVGELRAPDGTHFEARLHSLDGETLKKFTLGKKGDADRALEIVRVGGYSVTSVEAKPVKRNPPPPFITSTLQQEASRKLGFTAKRTMQAAQKLYEEGRITYMRTDGVNMAEEAYVAARAMIQSNYGARYLPENTRRYSSKAKNAQEAHEAIRPTTITVLPEAIRAHLNADQYALYELIWKRTVACQMAPAQFDTVAADITVGEGTFRATGQTLAFAGFLAVYQDDEDEEESKLPALAEGETLPVDRLYGEQHFTQPPPRYTEASLVRTLEENGIGRPSTYAPIMGTIQERGYVEQREKRLYPTELGFVVNDQLVQHFPDVFDVGFTARMEEALDAIADDGRNWVEVLREFYEPFAQQLQVAEATMERAEVQAQPIGEACPQCGHDLVLRNGRFGKFIACSNYPECRYTRPLVNKTGVACPKCKQGELVERRSKKGRTFFGCNRYPECDFTSWRRPLPQPCPNCGGLLVETSRKKAQC